MKISCLALLALGVFPVDGFTLGINNKSFNRRISQKVISSGEEVETPGATRIINTPKFHEVCDTIGVTLTRFMDEVSIQNPESRELTSLFGAIATACKVSAFEETIF